MKVIFVWLLFLVAACANETVGWRVPIEGVVAGGLENVMVSRLDKPPVESKFFQKGDELWDLSKVMVMEFQKEIPGEMDPFAAPEEGDVERIPFKGEWVVWNARSRMLVARGDWLELGIVEKALRIDEHPKALRLTVEVGDPDGAIRDRISFVAQSGESSKAASKSILIESKIFLIADMRWGNGEFEIQHEGETGVRYVTKGSVSIGRGNKVTVARRSSGADSWDIKLGLEILASDGGLIDDLCWIEIGNELVRVDRRSRNWNKTLSSPKGIPDGLHARFYDVPASFFDTNVGPAQSGGWRFRRLIVPAGIEVPDAERYVDVDWFFKELGVMFFRHDQTLLGFNPETSKLLMINDEANHEVLEGVVNSCGFIQALNVVVETSGGGVSNLIAAQSGTKAMIERVAEGGNVKLFEVTSDIGAVGDLLNVGYLVRSDNSGAVLQSSVTVKSGESVDIGPVEGGGEEKQLKLKATVVEE